MNPGRRNPMSSRHFPRLEIAYSSLYLTLLIPGIVFVVWYEYAYRVGDSAAETAYAILVGVGYVGVADAAITVGVIEGGIAIMVLARIWLERREQIIFEQGVEQGIEQGIEKGIEQGIEQGREQGRGQGIGQGIEKNQKKWEAWNHRRLLAMEEGREFDEPPPRPGDE